MHQKVRSSDMEKESHDSQLSVEELILLAQYKRCTPRFREHILCFATTAAQRSKPEPANNVIPFRPAA